MVSNHLSEEDDKRVPGQSHLEDLEYARSSDGPGLVNILHGIPKETLYNAVEAFTAEHGLQDSIQAFKKGALVAQRPHDFDNIDELTGEDKEALRYEVDHKWKQTGPLYFTGESMRRKKRRCSLTAQSWSVPSVQLVKDGIRQAQTERVRF
jgi:hypothetical protein